jgi:uncharacterized protein
LDRLPRLPSPKNLSIAWQLAPPGNSAYIAPVFGRSARGGPFIFRRRSLFSSPEFLAVTQPTPLMPHATASWLVDNTALSFEQIAEFCGLHILEVQAMADDLAASKYTGRDPLRSGELTMVEIEKGQDDPSYSLKMQKAPVTVSRTKGPRYTPVSKRQDKPDGIAWILRSHPEISDAQIGKLIGTTRNTIAAIRDRSHWNIANIQAKDPVTLGLCSQRELDAIVAKAAKKAGLIDQAGDDARLGDDRVALIEELRAEREALTKQAGEAAQEAEAAAWLEAKRTAESAES